jgi:hypothetical protein
MSRPAVASPVNDMADLPRPEELDSDFGSEKETESVGRPSE